MVEHADSLGPGFRLEVAEFPLTFGVTEFVDRIEYESTEGVVDMMKLTLNNPDFTLTKLKSFLPGNELSLWIGYAGEMVHLGRAVIANVRTTFPPDGMPGIQVTAYTKDHEMMETRPDPEPVEKAQSKSGKKDKEKVVTWKTELIEDVVTQIAIKYGFEVDVDPSPLAPKPMVQPVKMSDYEFIKGLSNLTGFYFWVDGDDVGTWTLHFKRPGNLVQEAKHKFIYRLGDATSLLSFQPEIIFKSHYTKISAQFTTDSGKVIKVSSVEDKELEEDPQASAEGDEWDLDLPSAESVQLFIGEYSFRAYPKVAIKDAATLEWWVQNWFKRHRQDFILGEGDLIGLPSLRARQIHELAGLTNVYDGDYEFTKVNHIIDPGAGYSCRFNCRRIA